MSDIKASHIKAKMLLVIAILGIFAIIWKFSSDQNQFSNLNLTKGNVNYSFTLDSCRNYAGIDKAMCYLNAGDLNRSLDACDNASNPGECMVRVGVEYAGRDVEAGLEVCERISGNSDARLLCYTGIAGIIAGGNTSDFNSTVEKIRSVCFKIENPEICGSNAARVLAHKDAGKAAYFCTVVMDGVSKSCYKSVADVLVKENLSKSIEVCGESSSLGVRNYCYNSVAKSIASDNLTEAVNICRESDEICYYDVANVIASVDPDKAFYLCGEMEMWRDDCYLSVAPSVSYNSSSRSRLICGRISDVYKQFDCYIRIASIISVYDIGEALEICNVTGEYCYSGVSVAVAQFNKTLAREICEKYVKNDFAYNNCIRAS